jgi:hypothetical protein
LLVQKVLGKAPSKNIHYQHHSGAYLNADELEAELKFTA